MSTERDTALLIERLSGELRPVRRLRPPAARALLWLAVVATVSALLIARFVDLSVITQRIAVPRIAAECIGSLLTGITAIFAAFQLSVPGRSRRWGLVPLPFLALWLAASGLGCLRNGWSPGRDGVDESAHCFIFILAVSVPLAAGLFWMLSRARPITPLPVAMLGTLGVAATAALLLQFVHPFDVTVIDLAFHAAAVALVMLVGTLLRRRLLAAG